MTALLAMVVVGASYQFAIWRQSQTPEDKTEQVAQAPPALQEQTESPEDQIPEPLAEQKQKRTEEGTIRQVQRERHGVIMELLAKAKQDIQASRLTSPKDNNALEHYQAVLALDPDNREAQQGLHRIVSAYLKLVTKAQDAHQFDKAKLYLQKAEAILPGAEDVRRARAQLAEKQTQVQRQGAIRRLLAKAKKDIKENRLISPKGNNALERFRQVETLDPGNLEARKGVARIASRYVELANAASTQGKFEKAASHLNKAEAISPESVEVHVARVRIAERKKELAKESKKKQSTSRPADKPAGSDKVALIKKPEKLARPKEDIYKIAIFPFAGEFGTRTEDRIVEVLLARINREPLLALGYSYYDNTFNAPPIRDRRRLWVGNVVRKKPNLEAVYRMGQERGVDGVVMSWVDTPVPHGAFISTFGRDVEIYVIDLDRRTVYHRKGGTRNLGKVTKKVLSDFIKGRGKGRR